MQKHNLLIISLLICCFCQFVKADIAPPPGYTKVAINLVVEVPEDVSDYKFYFDFFGDKKDVELKKGQNTIQPMGGGARYSAGTLWAVSKKDANQSPIELLKHQFSKEVSIRESQNVSSAIYRIERNGNMLKVSAQNQPISQKSGGGGGGVDFSINSTLTSFSISIFGYIVIIGFSLAIIFLGIWLFGKRGRKLN